MRTIRTFLALSFLVLSLSSANALQVNAASDRPRVRTITAFLHVDHDHYQAQFADAVTMLRAARKQFESDGWTVQTIRIATQPFPEYVRGMKHDAALAFLMELDAIAAKEEFRLAIGPAMSKDSDDTTMTDLLAEMLAKAKATNGTAIIAAEDGIHWKAVASVAKLIKRLAELITAGMVCPSP